MIPIKGFATFHPLKQCIVGKAHDPSDVDESLKIIMEETKGRHQTRMPTVPIPVHLPNDSDI